MLSDATVAEIVRLLEEGAKHRAIAKRVGVSRTTVGLISTGRRNVIRRPSGRAEILEQLGPLVRCKGCGGRTRLPCRVCLARDRPPTRSDTVDDEDDLALDLKPIQWLRYQEIRRRRGDR